MKKHSIAHMAAPSGWSEPCEYLSIYLSAFSFEAAYRED